MKKIIITIVLNACLFSAIGQSSVRDTVFIYEKIIVQDTIFISDTVRIKRAPAVQNIKPADVDLKKLSSSPATLPEICIIQSESNFDFEITEQKNQKVLIKKEFEEMKFSVNSLVSGILLSTQTIISAVFAQDTATLAPIDNNGQETTAIAEKEPLPTMPIQLSVFYPMTIMGDKTVDYRYNVSFNMFAGKVGAVWGAEFGFIYNHVLQDMTGAQFAGIANRTNEMNGAQFGGIANFNRTANGAQFAGIANVSESFKGVQFGGIANVSESFEGAQFGGIVNISKKTNGIQFGGIGNVNEELKGVSFGGIFNLTGTLEGVQFGGIVNVIDTIESGISVALINFVRKGGYRAWSLTTADYMTVALSFKMGIEKFYTILTLGGNVIMEDKLWVSGIGFGMRREINERFDFQPEIVAYRYHPRRIFIGSSENVNSTHLKCGFVYKLNDRLGLVVAPSLYHSNYDALKVKSMKLSPIPPIIKFDHNWSYKHYSTGEQIKGENRHSIGGGVSIGVLFR